MQSHLFPLGGGYIFGDLHENMPAITENGTTEPLTPISISKTKCDILWPAEAGKAPIVPPADTGKVPSIGHADIAIQEFQLLQTVNSNAAGAAAQSVAQSAAPPLGVKKNKKNKNKKNKNKNEKKKDDDGMNSAGNTQIDIAGGKIIGATTKQGDTIGSDTSPGKTAKHQRRMLLILEQIQNTAKVAPGTFIRPRPRYYGVQCPRTLGPQGASGCNYGLNCYYGHEGDVYPESTHKSSHYVDRWHSELTVAERLSMKHLMAWTTRPNKWRKRHTQTNEQPTFKAEPRLRAIDVPTHLPKSQQQQGSSVRTQGQRCHQRQGSLQSNGQSPHRPNSFRPDGQSPWRQNSCYSNGQSPHRYQVFSFPPYGQLQQYRSFPFQNTGPISPREYFGTGPIYSPEYTFPYNGGPFHPQAFAFQPVGPQIIPQMNSFPTFPTQSMHRRNSVQSHASHNSYDSYQAQHQPAQQYPQVQFPGSYGSHGSHQQAFSTPPHVMQPFQGYIGHAGMNTRNMEQVPQISPEDFLFNWHQEIEREGWLVPLPISDVRLEPFKFRPEAPEFVPDAAKNWPGLKKGYYPSYPFDAKGIFIPSVANPGFLIWTAAGYGYYGHDGSWYPYREPTGDDKGTQKDLSSGKNGTK